MAPDGTAKLTDFGIARAADLSIMTRTGMVMGTPHYMSPEQAKGERVDIRSDIYSLGVVLYQMFTGELPFQADTPWQIIRLHIDAKPPQLRRARPDLSRALDAIVERCLEKEPRPTLPDPRRAGPGPAKGPARRGHPHSPSSGHGHATSPAPGPRAATTGTRGPTQAWESAMRRQRRTPIRVRFLALLALVGIVGGALYLTVPPLPDPDPIVGTEGARLWEFPIQSGVTPLAVDPAGDLYIYSEDHAIHAIDGRTGTERWRSGFPTSVTGAALGPDGSRLYVGSTDGAVLAFETSDGSIISEYGLGQEVFPAAGPGGELYATSFDGTLYRLSPQDDRLLWFTKVGASIEAAPVVGPDGTVYVPTNEPGSIVAVSPDAEKLWSADIGPVHVSPTLGSVYVAADDGVLYAL